MVCLLIYLHRGEHASVYLLLGIVCTLIFCLTPPAATLAVMFKNRNSLDKTLTLSVYGFMYRRYRRVGCVQGCAVMTCRRATEGLGRFGGQNTLLCAGMCLQHSTIRGMICAHRCMRKGKHDLCTQMHA